MLYYTLPDTHTHASAQLGQETVYGWLTENLLCQELLTLMVLTLMVLKISTLLSNTEEGKMNNK